NGAEQSIGDSVQQDVSVGMAAQAPRMWQGQAANLQRNAPLEFVRVPAVADASFRFQVFRFPVWSLVVGRSVPQKCPYRFIRENRWLLLQFQEKFCQFHIRRRG